MELNEMVITAPEEDRRAPNRSRKLRRGIYILPSAFTVANMLCGYYAILATLDGRFVDFDRAACAIGFAYLFDSMDGRVARMMGTESAFGREFDSLADVVSFGIAPAILMYAWAIRGLTVGALPGIGVLPAIPPEWLHLKELGWLIGFSFAVCCAWRLARFNIQGMAPGGNRYFVGMPTPAAAGMLAAIVHFFKGEPVESVPFALFLLALMIVLGALMSSTIRFFSFKDIPLTKRMPSLSVIVLAILVGAVVYFSRQTLLIVTAAYTIHGPILQLIRSARLKARPA
jgi:CDP-diacylglycerol--serine O-phosphatidyltransferase